MDGRDLRTARETAGISQSELARRAGTSRETVSAYENDHKSPTMATTTRLLAAVDHELAVAPRPRFTEVPTARGRTIAVPSVLPRLPALRATAVVSLPLHLDWSATPRTYDLARRRPRARVYEVVLREGTPSDVVTYIDGALLIDLWDELVLPREVREAWQPVVTRTARAAA